MIPVLFARSDSIYKTFPQCDVYDVERNALTYSGQHPVIAHPPCRLWGRLSHMSKAPASEKELAIWAVEQIREKGGVLEHPKASTLWKEMGMPRPNWLPDNYGGYTIEVKQFWWGHKADKATWLYIVGCPKTMLPKIPFVMGDAEYVVGSSRGNKLKRDGKRKTITKPEREATPHAFALWLIQLVSGINMKVGYTPPLVSI